MIRILPVGASENDRDLIAFLSRKTFYNTYYADNKAIDIQAYTEANFSDPAIEAELADPNNIFLVYEDQRAALGYAKLSLKQPDYAPLNGIELGRLYCIEEAIGKGVGSALMNSCISIGKSMSRDEIWLGVWEHNKRAIDFYVRKGFIKFCEHFFMLGNDKQTDWLMKRSL